MGDPDPQTYRKPWENYPFADEFRDVPIGWVLEKDSGGIVGSLANVQLLYDLAGKRLKAVIAAGWAVDPAHRIRSLQLMSAFYQQQGVDLFFNGSANPTTAKVLTGLKIPRMPIPDYSTPCFWAARPQAFAKAVLVRRGTPAASVLSYPAGLALLVRDVLVRSGRGSYSTVIRTASGFDERFDSLWEEVRKGPARLRAIRTRAVLEWRFGAERPVVITSERDGKLAGYAVLVKRPGPELGMSLNDVADLQAVRDDRQVIRDLLLGAVAHTRKTGMDAVKFVTGTPSKRAPAVQLHPYTYVLPLWQLYWKAASPELASELTAADSWDFSRFDTY